MIMQFLCSRDTKVSSYHMKNVELTFNDLPQVVAELRDEVVGMKVVLLDLQKSQTKQKLERVRRTMNVEEQTRQALGLVQRRTRQVAGGETQECRTPDHRGRE